jgi:hypothetical protein
VKSLNQLANHYIVEGVPNLGLVQLDEADIAALLD